MAIRKSAKWGLILGGLIMFGMFGSLFGGDEEKEGLKVGDSIPKVSLKASDGKTYNLPEIAEKGDALIIAWIPKTFTPGWTKQCKALRDSAKKISEYKAKLFVISTDDAEKAKEFAESLGNAYPILADPNRKAAKLFGVDGFMGFAKRATFIFDNSGKLVDVDRKVKLGSHGSDVVEKLDKLKIQKKQEE